MIHIFTITARNYLSLALTLGDSVSRHHPEARFTIFVADGLDGIDAAALQHVTRDARQALGPRFDLAEAFKYNVTEYCTAIKPALFRQLFAESDEARIVYYMDPDTCLYDRLDPITEAAPDKSLFLAPHLLHCRLADDNPYPEYKHLFEGIFNLGFCAIRRSAQSALIVDWWDARLREYCYADFQDGLHTDQKWMDYAPAFFGDALCICRHLGVNVAHWNIIERHLERRNGKFFVEEQPLIFFHFSGFDFRGQGLTKNPSPRLSDFVDATIVRLTDDYRQAVWANGYERFIGKSYVYAAYTDGLPVSQQHRRLFRAAGKPADGDPFSAQGPFRQRIARAGLLDASAAATRSHSAATVDNLPAVHARLQRLLRLSLRVLGPRRYVYLSKFFGAYGRFEAHGFLLNPGK